ncbi:MAG TPA: hypothetical protein PK971_12530, partial [Saprospiraceae bacterium]|nr:hypothetical protein [Saprospiraceae bacterium]
MRYFLTFSLCISLCTQAVCQQPENPACTNPKSQIDLAGNNIRARLLNGGDMFSTLSKAGLAPNSQDILSPGTIYVASLWMGGLDAGGNLRMAATGYRSSGKTDFWAGPLTTSGTTDGPVCATWDRHFNVRGVDIAQFLQNLPALAANPFLAIAEYQSIMGWPSKGNPYFLSIYGFDLPSNNSDLAPFYDSDSDGVYNPLKGDYPVVQLRGFPSFVPAEMVWWVINDEGGGAFHSSSSGQPIRMEVQTTAWAFNCPDKPVLNNTVFTSHKMLNRAPESIDSFFVGMWVDFDLGCPADDYLGCSPQRNSMFAYNIDMVDGQPGSACDQGIKTFGEKPPVQSATFLNTHMDKFLCTSNGSPTGAGDPTQDFEFYNNLSGRWRDGSPLTYGGTGFGQGNPPVDHLFPDDPADSNGWSMCTAALPSSDRRALGTHKIGRLNPGQIEELNMAWTYHPRSSFGPCDLGPTY